MASGYDGSIRIRALMDHGQFDRGLRSMTNSIRRFSGTLTKLAATVGLAFGVAAIVNFGKESVKAASALSDAWLGLQSILEGQGKSFSKAKSFINDYISDGLVPLENAVTSYKNLAARGYNTEQIQKTMTALKDAAAFGRQASYSLGDAVSTATEGLKNENSILVDNAGVTKNVAKMWDDYARSIGTTANNLTQEQKIQAEVNGILEETRFQTGDAAKLASTYSGQIAMLGFNFQQLKVEVGNALIPIARAVLPGINAIISALTKLAKVFAQVTALLFGKSSEVKVSGGVESSALSASDATDKLADSTGNLGDASKKAGKDMKNVQAGFDELNILASKAAGSLDDAAGGMDMSGAELEIPEYEADTGTLEDMGEKFNSLGELFVQTLDNMLAAMPGFKEELLKFAEGFNEFNQRIYDAFTFPGVKERVEQLGRELADAFNGLTNTIDWELWGRKLGSGFNLGLQLLTELLYSYDWAGLGKRLAELVNGIVYEVDWYDFGRLLWTKFKLALEAFAGFILGLDMPALAQAASSVIKGFFDSMQESIANIDWAGIGRQIAEFLNNVDWIGIIASLAGALSSMVGAALELIGGFISNADPGTLLIACALLGTKLFGGIISTVIGPLAKQLVENIISKIATLISSSGLSSILSSIGSAISGIAKTLGGITAIIGGIVMSATSFFDMWNNGFSLAKEAVMLLGIALTAIGAIILGAPALVAGIVAGIVAAVATLAVLVKEHWEEIKEAFINAWHAVQDAWNAAGEWFGDHVIQPIAEFFSGLWAGVQEAASNTWTFVQNAWASAGEWFHSNIIEPLSVFFSEMWESIKQFASEAWENVQSAWSSASEWFNTNIIQPIIQFFSEMWENVKQFASDAWIKVQETWIVVSEWFSANVIEPTKQFFSDLWENAKQFALDAWANVKETWNVVSGWFNENVTKPVGNFFSSLWSDVRTGAETLWSNVVAAWQSAGEWFRTNVTDPIKNAFSGMGDAVKGILNGVISAIEGLINGAIKGINWLIQKINGLIGDGLLSEGLKFLGLEGGKIPPLGTVSLPRLANGAVIPPNQQFAAILGDQRSGKNLEAPADLIRQMVMEGIRAAGYSGNSGGTMTVILELDGREFGRAAYKYGNAERQRVGVRLTEVTG